MPRRSCLTNLIVAEELSIGMADQGEPVDVVYFDWVCHRLLVKKMVAMGMRFLSSLLKRRRLTAGYSIMKALALPELVVKGLFLWRAEFSVGD